MSLVAAAVAGYALWQLRRRQQVHAGRLWACCSRFRPGLVSKACHALDRMLPVLVALHVHPVQHRMTPPRACLWLPATQHWRRRPGLSRPRRWQRSCFTGTPWTGRCPRAAGVDSCCRPTGTKFAATHAGCGSAGPPLAGARCHQMRGAWGWARSIGKLCRCLATSYAASVVIDSRSTVCCRASSFWAIQHPLPGTLPLGACRLAVLHTIVAPVCSC